MRSRNKRRGGRRKRRRARRSQTGLGRGESCRCYARASEAVPLALEGRRTLRSMRCGAIPLLLGALLAAVAACSGGTETYALEPTAACLEGKGVRVVELENPA